MSQTFTVSALSTIQVLDESALRRALGIPADARLFSYTYEQARPFLRSSSPDEIARWWTATQNAHISQQKVPVHWDEVRTTTLVRDVYADQDLELTNLLAYIDQLGTDDFASGFRGRARGCYGSDAELLRATHARGFSVRFPQASIAPECFLPFPANIVLEVPDWRGETNRLGSLPNLARELAEILDLVSSADCTAALAGRNDVKHQDRLAGAYNAARIKLELADEGLRENLPFWFSE